MTHLSENKRIKADNRYVGEVPEFIKCPKRFINPEETLTMQGRACIRQETVNNRFKNWGVLRQMYCYSIPTRGDTFQAVAVITQISVLNGDNIFECRYCNSLYINYHNNDSIESKNSEHEDEEAHSDVSFDSSSF